MKNMHCCPNEPLVAVLGKWILFSKRYPFGVDFEIYNLAGLSSHSFCSKEASSQTL